jgi:hypothetical protein
LIAVALVLAFPALALQALGDDGLHKADGCATFKDLREDLEETALQKTTIADHHRATWMYPTAPRC